MKIIDFTTDPTRFVGCTWYSGSSDSSGTGGCSNWQRKSETRWRHSSRRTPPPHKYLPPPPPLNLETCSPGLLIKGWKEPPLVGPFTLEVHLDVKLISSHMQPYMQAVIWEESLHSNSKKESQKNLLVGIATADQYLLVYFNLTKLHYLHFTFSSSQSSSFLTSG